MAEEEEEDHETRLIGGFIIRVDSKILRDSTNNQEVDEHALLSFGRYLGSLR